MSGRFDPVLISYIVVQNDLVGFGGSWEYVMMTGLPCEALKQLLV